MTDLPETQYAIQLVGPDELVLNRSKEVFRPGACQILCRVEAVGLCFSDLKLLKQFSAHGRKSEIVSGIAQDVLSQIPSYVPGQAPTVPGHEAIVTIEATGKGVEKFSRGQRYLVQTDYRWLKTATSNAALGYNFEGALQQYVLMDERVITSPQGQSMLIPVSDKLSASAAALVEPWACVEDAYASEERTCIKKGGRMLIAADKEIAGDAFDKLFAEYGRPGEITWLSKYAQPDMPVKKADTLAALDDNCYDDIVYFGSNADIVEGLFAKAAAHGLVNIVLCGGRLGREVETMIGRVHYGGIRIVGTPGLHAGESMRHIPQTGEIRKGDTINVVGAAGPMGTMHVIRNLCLGVEGVSVFAGDVDDNRLNALSRIAAPLANQRGLKYKAYNAGKEQINEQFDYIVLMAPVPALVAASVQQAAEGGIVNIFAGIPASVTGKIDLDKYIEKRLYFIGTSGSVLEDMHRVLARVESGTLDTDVSVAAVCGIEGAAAGMRAVERREVAGKIVVYPHCKGLELTLLEDMNEKMPAVAELLENGLWTKQAERKLLEMYQN